MNYVTRNTQLLSLLDNQGHDAAYITMTLSHTHAQIEEPSLQLQHKSLNTLGTDDQACQCGEQIDHPPSTTRNQLHCCHLIHSGDIYIPLLGYAHRQRYQHA